MNSPRWTIRGNLCAKTSIRGNLCAKTSMNFMVVDEIGDNIRGRIWILVFGQPWPNLNSSSADGGKNSDNDRDKDGAGRTVEKGGRGEIWRPERRLNGCWAN
jgi:hypothetical protein